MSNYNVEISADNTITVGLPSKGGNMSNYNVEISADNTITVGLPSTGNGVAGPRGEKGYSAYEVAVKNGYNGTEEEWVNKWLRGTIVSADVDDAGVMSMTDINGNVINTNLAPIAKAASSASAAEASAQAAATSANEAATHETNAASSLAEAKKSEQNAKSSEQNAAASATAAANSAREQQADWAVTDTTSKAFVKNKPDVLLKSGGTVTGTITASKFSGPLTGNVTGTADKAIADGSGNNIVNTYVTKSGLASSVTTTTGKVTTLTATDSTLTNVTITGATSVPTANEGNSSNTIASTEFVAKSLAKMVDSAPESLNTLNELAKALGNDPNFAATIINELGKKMNSVEAESTYAKKGEAGVLPGTVTAFSGAFKDGYPVDKNTGLVNREWHLCDGTNGTPDLRNRFIYGGTGTNNGATGGEVSHTLTGAELPKLSGTVEHVILNSFSPRTSGVLSTTYIKTDAHGYGSDDDFYQHTLQITFGGNQPHNNMPPYYVLAFMMKL